MGGGKRILILGESRLLKAFWHSYEEAWLSLGKKKKKSKKPVDYGDGSGLPVERKVQLYYYNVKKKQQKTALKSLIVDDLNMDKEKVIEITKKFSKGKDLKLIYVLVDIDKSSGFKKISEWNDKLFEAFRLSPRIIVGYSKSGNPHFPYEAGIDNCFNLRVMEYIEVLDTNPDSFTNVYKLSMDISNRSTGLRSYYLEQLRQKNKRIIRRKPGVYDRLERQTVDDALGSLSVAMIRWSDLSNVRDMVLGHAPDTNQSNQLEKQTCGQFIQSAGSKLKDVENKIQFLICGNDLVDYYPDTMPASFWSQLKMFACSCNELTELVLSGEDRETGEPITMPNLVELYASHNSIKSIDPNISDMKNLRLLDLASNRLDTIPPEIFLLENLETLDLSINKLNVIPSDIGRLSKLRRLYLDDNNLETLPFNLFLLEKLEELHLQNNQLRKLPPTLGSMKALRSLKLDNNPHLVNSIPKPVLLGGIEVLKSFLEESNLRGERCYRTKLMIVGQENVGKTSLLKSLVNYTKDTKAGNNTQRKKNQKSQMSGKPLSTDGIDIHNVFYETEIDVDGTVEKRDIVFNVWDFAGQEVYYTTHSFFLTDRSVFVLVFNMVLGADNCKVEYWLNSVKARSPNSPIMLVGTHLDSEKIKRSKAIQEMEKLLKKYKKTFKIRSAIALSCETNENLAEFIDSLLNIAKKEPYMGSMIPSSYFTLEDLCLMERQSKLLEGVAPISRWDEIRSVALKSNFISNPSSMSEEAIDAQLSVAIDVLHLLGTVVRFKDVGPSLDKIVILDPQWVTKIFSTIITTKKNFIKDGIVEIGVLFAHVWREFPQSLHPVLLGLLESFEILFRLPDDIDLDRQKAGKEDIKISETSSSSDLLDTQDLSLKTKLLIPSLLSEVKPEFNLIWPDRDPDTSRIQYSRLYEFVFMPNGLFSRFVIRLMKFSDALRYWRYGLLIKTKKSNAAMALIELDQNVNKITIHVRGESPAEFFRTIIELLDSLLHHWFKVQANISAVCPICIQHHIENPTLFTKEECLDSSARGSWFLQCQAEEGNDHLVKMEQIAPDIAMADFEGKRIDLEREVTIQEEIGKGAYGIVYKGLYNKEVVAIKKLIISGKSEEEAKDIYNEFRKEVWIMSGLQHPCIVNLKGFSLQPSMAMVMELVKDGDLHQFLSDKSKPLDWDLRLRIAWDIAKGLAFLHSTNPPLLHRDIKSPNILLANTSATSSVVAKIADFGLTGHIFTEKFAAQKARDREVVNPVWLAPEVMREQPYATAADVYPYGVILWELFTRKHPFDEFNFEFMSDLEKAIKDGTRPTIPEDCPEDYANFINNCWDGDPQKRPSFKAIIEQWLPPLIDKYAPEIKPAILAIEEIEKNSIAVKKEIEQAKDGEKSWIAGTHLSVAETSNDTIAYMVSSEKYVWCITNRGVFLILNSDTGKLIGRYDNAISKPKEPILGMSYDSTYRRVVVVQPSVILAYNIKSIGGEQEESIKEFEAYIVELEPKKKKKKARKFIRVDEKVLSIYKSKEEEKPELELSLMECNVQQNEDGTFMIESMPLLSKCYLEDEENVDVYTMLSSFIESAKSQECKLPSKVLYESKGKRGDIISYYVAPDCIVILDQNNVMKFIKGTKTLKGSINFSDVFTCERPKICYVDVEDYLWISYESDIHVVDIDQKKILETLKGHSTTIASIIKAGNEVWSYSIDNQVKVWDLERKLMSTFKLHHYVNCMISLGPDVLLSQVNGLHIYKVSTKEKVKTLERRHEDPVKSMLLVESETRTVWTLSDVSIHIWK